MTTLPTVITSAGLQPIPPTTIRQNIVDEATALSPGLTANLPGSLIEDIASTITAGVAQAQQAMIDTIAGVTPYGANVPMLYALGAERGIEQGIGYNVSVYVNFTGSPGYVINKGFLVTDGTYQYVVQDTGIIPAVGGVSLYCLATVAGSWAVPANTVTMTSSSVPSSIIVFVDNPLPGNPGGSAETEQSYRARVLQAGLVASSGMPSMVKALVGRINGVESNLISVATGSPYGYKIIVGPAGDPYLIATAIYQAVFDPTILIGSTDLARNVSIIIDSYPDVYTILFVRPVMQTLAILINWATSNPYYAPDAAIATLAQQPIIDYINGLSIGDPINLFSLTNIFQDAISPAVPTQSLSKLTIYITIDGVLTPPVTGESLVYGNSEGYFSLLPSAITLTRIS